MERWSPLPDSALELADSEPCSALLHTARYSEENHCSFFFCRPERVLETHTLAEVPEVFAQMEGALSDGLYTAGYVAYECGAHFEPTVGTQNAQRYDPGELPLIWLGCYAEPLVFDHRAGAFVSGSWPRPCAADATITDAETKATHPSPQMDMDAEQYRCAIESILEKIRLGQTYQANFTCNVSFPVNQQKGDAIRLYRQWIQQQPVAYGAYLNLGKRKIASLSPELFFRRNGERIVTRPMKGTMPRGLDVVEDQWRAEQLRNDAKNRAEHLMIVDLLRNDLGRIALPGSVQVEDLFTVETYPTLLQMTSTIAARISPTLDFHSIYRALFPCGSITGAPKVNTMRILASLESRPRGVYCGAIGYASPKQKAVFSVAIRTLVIDDGMARMGVGGGIVADSVAEEEWQECRLKARFLDPSAPEFELIETMLWQNGVALLRLHLERLAASARYFDFNFDEAEARQRIADAAQNTDPRRSYRLRLLLDRFGRCHVNAQPLEPLPAQRRIALSEDRVVSTDRFLRHKTTHRAVYERYRRLAAEMALSDFLFVNESGEVTEGTISNVFVECDGHLLTPPVSAGLLPGVFRQHLLETHPNLREQTLTPSHLKSADGIFLCNALRGLYRVELLDPDHSEKL